MKFKFLLLVVVCVVVFGVLVVSVKVEDGVLMVGVMFLIMGLVVVFGILEKNVLMFVLIEIGGFKVKLIVFDDVGDLMQVMMNVKCLINDDKVDVIFGFLIMLLIIVVLVVVFDVKVLYFGFGLMLVMVGKECYIVIML